MITRKMILKFKEGPVMYLEGVENFSIYGENNTLLGIKYTECTNSGRYESSAFFDISELLYFGWANFLNKNLTIDTGIEPGI